MNDEEPGRRRHLLWASLLGAILLLLATLLWSRREQAGSCQVTVLSEPAGAEILVNLRAGHGLTPGSLSLPAHRPALIQVRLAGHEAEPISHRLERKDLAAGTRSLSFKLVELAQPTPVQQVGGAPPSAAAATIPTPRPVGLGSLLELGAAPFHPADSDLVEQGHTLAWSRWDAAFRLKIDGRVLPQGAARALDPGPRRLQVDLRGRVLLDTLLARGGMHRLALPPREHFVELMIEPPEAEIIRGDELLGRGRCLIHRFELPLVLRFPRLTGLLAPPPLSLTATAPLSMELAHHAPLSLEWRPAGSSGIRLEATGYVMPGEDFRADAASGPRAAGSALVLGRAFMDRRPGGSQALRLAFDLPMKVNPEWSAELVLVAADSGQRYPLVLTRGAALTVLINGTVLARELPLADSEQARAWPVSSLLQTGRNLVQVQTTEASRSRALLYRVELRIGT
ncbi:MAG: hypothetical protein Q8O14_05600 [bacterium]|nr:hypothetical protein [bacterium]